MSEKTIFSRIIDFQKSMPTVKKDGKNPFYKKKYAPLDSIQKAIQEPLATAGLGYTQEAANEGLKTTLFDVDGNIREFIYPAIFSGKPQEIGSAMTYAKRYALTACLGLIIEGEDDDGNNAQNQEQEYDRKQAEQEKVKQEITNQANLLVTKIDKNEKLQKDKTQAWFNAYKAYIPTDLIAKIEAFLAEVEEAKVEETQENALLEDKQPITEV